MKKIPPRFLAAATVLVTFAIADAHAAAATQQNVLTPLQISEGWISLFDGQTLFGWQPTSDADWKVENDAVSVAAGKPGFLMTASEFADYELHVEFQAPDATNSGVFLRTPLAPTDPHTDCFELNIAPRDNPFPTGSLVSRKKWAAGALASNLSTPAPLYGATSKNSLTDKEPERHADPNQVWHSFDVRASGAKLTVWLDGRELYDFDGDGHPPRGHIGLQFREGPVAFRNVRLRPVGLKPMLNGKDLEGWNADHADASKFEMTPEGELHLAGGKGQLETDASYGDFVMQFDCRVDGDNLNSGVFFRSIPRDMMNGYECQINNAMIDNDPTKPKDAGTGAIYRRVNARRVVSRDHEWFTATLMAVGPHIAVWVNGQQVTDWTDDRPPSDNPREGLRLAPGTIALQGHDATTNLRFRNMKIAELADEMNHEDTKTPSKDKQEVSQ